MTVCQYSSLIYPGHRPPSPLYKRRYNRDSLALQLSRVEALLLFYGTVFCTLYMGCFGTSTTNIKRCFLLLLFESQSTNEKTTGDFRETTH